jgi:hypothetical protein
MVTTLALVLVAISLVSGSSGWSAGVENAEQATLSAQSDPAALEPIDIQVAETFSYRVADIASRGGERPGDFFVNRPMPALDATLAEASAADMPASTDASSAATASPEPTGPPEPTVEPTSEPLVAMSLPLLTGTRVGIQAGHWKCEEFPAELASLRTSTGAAGKGWREVDINLQLSRKVIVLLEARGIEVDLLPATVPPDYKADAFVSIHGDANNNTGLSGFKIARSARSTIPAIEDRLVAAMRAEYEVGTGLKWHQATITPNMLHYYAFNQRLRHSVAPTTPSVILEIGFLTNAGDLKLVTEQQDRIAQAIADGIVRFLESR